MKPRRPLAGRRALVTGGASGIGEATVRRLAADGAAVVIDYVGDAGPAEAVAAEIARGGTQALAVRADVSDEDEVEMLFARAHEAFGPVDILVNNAGRERPFALVDMPLEEWNAVLALNLTGPFLCSRAMVRGLADGIPGVIVNVSSVHEVIPWPQFSHYCASKGGLKLFTQTIARELAPRGALRVTAARPGGAIQPPPDRPVVTRRRRRLRSCSRCHGHRRGRGSSDRWMSRSQLTGCKRRLTRADTDSPAAR